MSTNTIEEQVVKFKHSVQNIIHGTPLTTTGRKYLRNMKIGVFEDFPGDNGVLTIDEYRKQWIVDANFDPPDNLNIDYEIGTFWSPGEITKRKTEKLNFETTIEYLNDEFFLIMGSPKAGKTTYLHFLINKFFSTHIFHVENFEETSRSFVICK